MKDELSAAVLLDPHIHTMYEFNNNRLVLVMFVHDFT